MRNGSIYSNRGASESHIMRARISHAKKEASNGGLLLWRLFSGDQACSNVFEATDDEALKWNANAREFYAWRTSLGKDPLPILEWRLEKDNRASKIFRVTYTEGGLRKLREVLASNAGDARAEFSKWANVVARIISIEEDEQGGEA